SGERYRKLRNVEIHTVELGESACHIPISGVLERFNTEGERTSLRTIEVDIDTMVVNHETVAGQFTLEPQPTERLFNSDKGMFIPG
ncbi:MAG: hypothetical protein ACIAXF_00480, partial [Phycisphaerales bacterium JB063]